MTFDIDAIRNLIEESMQTTEVCVPSRDYYARSDDWTRTDITYLCPHTLLRKLDEMVESERKLPGGNYE